MSVARGKPTSPTLRDSYTDGKRSTSSSLAGLTISLSVSETILNIIILDFLNIYTGTANVGQAGYHYTGFAPETVNLFAQTSISSSENNDTD